MGDYLGYVASILVLCTFCAKTMLPLRSIALGSNLAFISYGALLHLYPVLMLHAILLPLNTWRLAEILLLSKRTQKMVGSEAIFTRSRRSRRGRSPAKARSSSAKAIPPTVSIWFTRVCSG